MIRTNTKKLILIGRTGSGKTTLIQRLERQALRYRKTQTVCSHLHFIDTPGEYLENRGFYKALIVTSADADAIGLVQDCTDTDSWLPPAFASAFAKEAVGIVTKTDLADGEAIARAEETLRRAGVGRIFHVSAARGEGLEPLMTYMGINNEEEG